MDGLKKVYGAVAQLKLLPDAGQHAQFIDGLGNAIVQYIQTVSSSTIGGPSAGMGGPGGGMGGMPPMGGGGPPGMGAPGPQQIAPGGGAGMSGLAPQGQIDPQQLRQLLSAGGGPG